MKVSMWKAIAALSVAMATPAFAEDVPDAAYIVEGEQPHAGDELDEIDDDNNVFDDDDDIDLDEDEDEENVSEWTPNLRGLGKDDCPGGVIETSKVTVVNNVWKKYPIGDTKKGKRFNCEKCIDRKRKVKKGPRRQCNKYCEYSENLESVETCDNSVKYKCTPWNEESCEDCVYKPKEVTVYYPKGCTKRKFEDKIKVNIGTNKKPKMRRCKKRTEKQDGKDGRPWVQEKVCESNGKCDICDSQKCEKFGYKKQECRVCQCTLK